MSKRCLILISDDLSLQSYFQTTLQVIGLSCQIIDNKNNLSSQTGGGEVVFFDPYNRFCSMDGLFSRWNGLPKERSPVFILLAESFSSLPDGFQFAIQRDFDRKELCRLLDTLEVSYSKDPDSSLWYQTVVPAKMEEFLKNLREKKLEIEPVYRNGDFHYPVVEHFFAGDQDDALYLLHDLVARNILKKKIFDKIHRCPQCHSPQINFRETCPQCRGIEFQASEMFHHFPCGYVGKSQDFQVADSDELRCPKCSRILRHIGLDYEKLIRSSHCSSCGTDFSVPGVRCICLQCRRDFEPQEAVMEEIYRYSWNSLPDNLSGSPEREVADGTVSQSTFSYLFGQSCRMARECGIPLSLILLDARDQTPEKQNQLLHQITSECDSAEAVWQESEGFFLLLPFGYSHEKSASNLDTVKQRLDGLLQHLGIPVLPEVHSFPVQDTSDTAKLFQNLLEKIKNRKENKK